MLWVRSLPMIHEVVNHERFEVNGVVGDTAWQQGNLQWTAVSLSIDPPEKENEKRESTFLLVDYSHRRRLANVWVSAHFFASRIIFGQDYAAPTT